MNHKDVPGHGGACAVAPAVGRPAQNAYPFLFPFHGVARSDSLPRHYPTRLSLTSRPFIARSVCMAIADFPKVNASIAGESLIVHGAIHLAIAVDLNFDGLVAPVIRDAGSKRLAELAREIHTIANRARDNKLLPDDLAGATYTISNSGSFGTLITAPIINQPQVAILSADGVKKKPVVIEGPGGDSIAIHPVGILAQSFDHRAIDGAYSSAFLRRTREIIEEHDWATELAVCRTLC